MLTYNRAVNSINKYLRARGSASRKRIVEHFSEAWHVNHKVIIMYVMMMTNAGHIVRNFDGHYESASIDTINR